MERRDVRRREAFAAPGHQDRLARQHRRYVRADPLADLLERRRIHAAPP
jgi:hypothetical protein